MRKNRKTKFVIMITLMVAISAMSLGFAVFSATLNISSSASVTPSSDDFKLHLHNQTTHTSDLLSQKVNIVGYNGAIVDSSVKYLPLSALIIPNYNINFTEPGQYVEVKAYIVNEGYYDAYLGDIIYNNVEGTDSFISCTVPSDSGASQALVDAACDDFTVTVDIDGNLITEDEPYLYEYVLPQGEAASLTIRFIYDANGDRADGAFDVQFGSITIDFSTVERELISFYVNGVEHQAILGMNWKSFLTSSYNISGFRYNGDYTNGICIADRTIKNSSGNFVIDTDNIIFGEQYSIGGICGPEQ
ncbi:MAG: hypothetical protein J6C28_06995 [Bacilli bacterium]|nr:hypothetical protein [Bacilli bacterium]